MKVCALVTTALAVQPNKLSLVMVSEGPSSQLRAVDQVVCLRGTGWALELARRLLHLLQLQLPQRQPILWQCRR